MTRTAVHLGRPQQLLPALPQALPLAHAQPPLPALQLLVQSAGNNNNNNYSAPRPLADACAKEEARALAPGDAWLQPAATHAGAELQAGVGDTVIEDLDTQYVAEPL
ncbi:hypothetical protein T492DRAFT_873575 [Pavlovales sp. CCMP2436]|nr:hypothetical protein T492DRAFT_873575 [Pavlovales sp. CCMP2436]